LSYLRLGLPSGLFPSGSPPKPFIHVSSPPYMVNNNNNNILINVAITGDGNMIKREDEKILKYKDLITEIQRMLNVKAN
jgi:hypothetical protein